MVTYATRTVVCATSIPLATITQTVKTTSIARKTYASLECVSTLTHVLRMVNYATRVRVFAATTLTRTIVMMASIARKTDASLECVSTLTNVLRMVKRATRTLVCARELRRFGRWMVTPDGVEREIMTGSRLRACYELF